MSDVIKVLEHYGVEVNGQNKTCCPIHSESTSSFTVYEDGGKSSWYCFGACSKGGDALELVRELEPDMDFKQAVTKLEEILGHKVELGSGEEKKRSEKPTEALPLPIEVLREIAATTTYQNVNYRGIRKETDEYFKHRSVVRDGKVVTRYYPETNNDGQITGLKARQIPKDFRYGKIGTTGNKSQLSGQFLCKGAGKFVLIVGGEDDKAAAHQMFVDYQKSRGQEDLKLCDVVSPTTGEGSAATQCAAQYDFLDQYDNIIIGMDNDKAGEKATQDMLKVLPKEKLKVVKWSEKDPHQMLEKGLQKQFIRDFYSSKEVIATGIKSSKDADAEMLEELTRKKIPLPPFMCELQKMMAGGIPLGYIICIIAKSGIGKTSIINEMLYYWIFHSPYKMGVLSLELNAGQYNLAMLSRHAGKKIQLMESPEEAIAFINSPEIMEKRRELIEDEYGEPRWMLLDDRDGTVDAIIKKCEVLIKKHGCKILIVDPLQDVIEAASYEDKLKFIKWQKLMVKEGVTFCNITHVRKSGSSTDKDGKRINRELSEDDVHGMSEIIKSSGANIIVDRDKYSEDPTERNTTKVVMSKCRWTGNTGNAGEWYYDNQTHTMYDKNSYFTEYEIPIVEQKQNDNEVKF